MERRITSTSEELGKYFREHVDFKRACMDIGKTEQDVRELLIELKKWFKEQKHLPSSGMEEGFLEQFVLGLKGKQEMVRERLDAYFTIRTKLPVLYGDRDPQGPRVLAADQCLYMGVLPGMTSDRSRVVIFRLRLTDPQLLDIVGVLGKSLSMLDVWLRADKYVTRVYAVIDAVSATFGHVFRLSPARLREAAYCYQNVYPVRIQEIIFINVKPFLKRAINTFLRPLLKRKIANRLYVYTDDLTGFYQKVPLSMMPCDYGGEGPSLETLNQKWIAELNRHRDWLITVGAKRSDESKRIGKRSPDCVVM